MGIALWLAGGLAALLLARGLPAGRDRRWPAELAIALLTALLLGVVATALDFGGWQELDWRAGAFAFLGTLTAIAALRLIRA